MQAALKEVLGEHVEQKGSLVTNKSLRFDFSHFSKLSEEEIRKVELLVNKKIRQNIPLNEKRSIPIAEAKAMGATALFGEKYGENVRVITFDPEYSIELCGGTHVPATGMIGFFKIISETAVQAGVRRIEAITGIEALNYIFEMAESFKSLKEVLNSPKNIFTTVVGLIEENAQLKKEAEEYLTEKIARMKKELVKNSKEINGINCIVTEVDLPSVDAVKKLAYSLKSTLDNLYLVLGAKINGKPSITVMISENLVEERKLNAGQIVRELAKNIQGGGVGNRSTQQREEKT